MRLSDPMLETLGYRLIVRSGIRICQSLWATDEPRDPDQSAGLGEMLALLPLAAVLLGVIQMLTALAGRIY